MKKSKQISDVMILDEIRIQNEGKEGFLVNAPGGSIRINPPAMSSWLDIAISSVTALNNAGIPLNASAGKGRSRKLLLFDTVLRFAMSKGRR